jgi:DNA-binding response OmpR family regulator
MQSELLITGYRLNPLTYEIFLQGQKIIVSQKEFALAYYFFTNVDRSISRGELLKVIWGSSDKQITRSLDVHISWIRKKLRLEINSDSGYRLLAIYGFGYRLIKIDLLNI